MNSHQLRFIELPIRNTRLIGCPGSGKSTTLINKCKRHFTYQNEFIMLTFSRRACSDFISKGNNPNMFNRDNVRTIHSLAMSIMRNVYKTDPNVNTVVISTYYNMVDSSLNDSHLTEIMNMECFRNCKVIIVDEAQDVSEIQYKFIMILSTMLNIPVIMVGDPNQNIYQFQGGSDIHLINHPGDMLSLVDNYRSTCEIVDFINPFRIWNNLPALIAASNTHGEKPLVIIETTDNIIQHIISEINRFIAINGSENLHKIAIISPVKKSKPFYNFITHKHDYTNIGLQLIANHLDLHNIKFIQHYDMSQSDNSSKNNENIKPGYINLITSHGSKGLEFDEVYIVNFHLQTMGKYPSEKEYDEFKYLWYVSLSRAKTKLNIYTNNSKDIFPTIKNVPADCYNINVNEFLNKIHTPKFKDITNCVFRTTDMIENLTEDKLYEFEKFLKNTNLKIESEKLFHIPYDQECYEFTKHPTLYGNIAEHLFMFFYSKQYEYDIKCIIEIPYKYLQAYSTMKNKLPFIKCDFQIKTLSDYKNELNENEKNLYSYIFENSNSKVIRLVLPNIVQNLDSSKIVLICAKLAKIKADLFNNINNNVKINKTDNSHLIDIVDSIFDIQLYYYQLEYEAAYLTKHDFLQHKASFLPFAEKIQKYANTLLYESIQTKSFYKYQKSCIHPNFSLFGKCDLLSKDKIIELKFSHRKEINNKHILQLMLYYNSFYYKNPDISVEIWNIQMGIKYVITGNYDKWSFLKLMSINLLDGTKLKNVVFQYYVKDDTSWEIIEPSLNISFKSGEVSLFETITEIYTYCIEPVFYNSNYKDSVNLYNCKSLISMKNSLYKNEKNIRDIIHTPKQKHCLNDLTNVEDINLYLKKYGDLLIGCGILNY